MGDIKSATLAQVADIEITGTDALRKYVDSCRALARDFGSELDWAAEEMIMTLVETSKGNPWLMGIDVKIRARKIAKRARRAAELQRGCAAEMTKLWMDYRTQFAPAFGKKGKKGTRKKVFQF